MRQPHPFFIADYIQAFFVPAIIGIFTAYLDDISVEIRQKLTFFVKHALHGYS